MIRPTPRALAFRADEAALYAHDTLRGFHPDQRRVLIFAQGRTGSTLLESLMASTGHFRSQGEILSCDEREVRRPLAYLRGAAKRAGACHVVGHVKVYHLGRDRRRPVDAGQALAHLHDRGWHIVHLRRSDILRHALSTLVAEARGDFHRFDDRDERLSLRVDTRALRRLLDERRAFDRDEAAALGDLPRQRVQYETDLADAAMHQPTIDRLMDGIGLPRRPVRARTRKVNRFDPRELIRNYDAVDRIVQDQGLAW